MTGLVEPSLPQHDALLLGCIGASVALAAIKAGEIVAGRPFRRIEGIAQVAAVATAFVASGGSSGPLAPLWLMWSLDARPLGRSAIPWRVAAPGLLDLVALAVAAALGFPVGSLDAALPDGTVLTLIPAAIVAVSESDAARVAALRRSLAAERAHAERGAGFVGAVVDGLAVRDRFLESISHEMRTPLNAVLGLAETLEASERDAARKVQMSTLRRGAEDLLRFVENVLRYTTLVAGAVRWSGAPGAD